MAYLLTLLKEHVGLDIVGHILLQVSVCPLDIAVLGVVGLLPSKALVPCDGLSQLLESSQSLVSKPWAVCRSVKSSTLLDGSAHFIAGRKCQLFDAGVARLQWPMMSSWHATRTTVKRLLSALHM